MFSGLVTLISVTGWDYAAFYKARGSAWQASLRLARLGDRGPDRRLLWAV